MVSFYHLILQTLLYSIPNVEYQCLHYFLQCSFICNALSLCCFKRCEKTQPKFMAGTSQHTLLKNRIKALYISKSLITDENIMDKYTKEELKEALQPVSSIISKFEKVQEKHAVGTSHHTRIKKMIKAMYISKSLITRVCLKSALLGFGSPFCAGIRGFLKT